MLTEITFPKTLCEPVGLEPATLRGLGTITLLAGPNGAGKSRYLRLIQPIVQPALIAMQQLKSLQEQRVIWEGKPGVPRHIDDYRSAASLIKCSPTEIEAMPVIDLSYGMDQAIAAPVNQTENQRQATIQNAKGGGFRYPFQAMHVYAHDMARAIVDADNPRFSGHSTIHARASEALQFNKVLHLLLGRQISPEIDKRSGQVEAYFGGRPLNPAELSNGEKVLLAWSILLNCQGPALRSAIVIIDEPETHLHPAACHRAITTLVDSIVSDGQVFLATHSVPLIAQFGLDSLYFVKDGKAEFGGSNMVTTVLDGLLGGPDGRDRLRVFLGDAADLAFAKYCAECLMGPLPAEGREPDPQKTQLRTAILSERPTRLLDYGAGNGRMSFAIAETLSAAVNSAQPVEPMHFVLFNEPTRTTEATKAACAEAVGRIKNENVTAIYCDDFESLIGATKPRFNLVVMCNVFHEIPVTQWVPTFAKIRAVIAEDGFLVIFEDLFLRLGELPNEYGHLLVDGDAAVELFAEPRLLIRLEQSRLNMIKVPARCLANVTLDTIKATVRKLKRRAGQDIAKLRAGTDSSFQAGRRHGQAMATYTNAGLALEALGG